MSERPTPETDALDCEMHNPKVLQDRYSTMLEYSRKLERQRDEAREWLDRLIKAASAVVDRWEQPVWKDVEPTAAVIYRLRDALERRRNEQKHI